MVRLVPASSKYTRQPMLLVDPYMALRYPYTAASGTIKYVVSSSFHLSFQVLILTPQNMSWLCLSLLKCSMNSKIHVFLSSRIHHPYCYPTLLFERQVLVQAKQCYLKFKCYKSLYNARSLFLVSATCISLLSQFYNFLDIQIFSLISDLIQNSSSSLCQ